jgi:hypothetical protein
MNKTHDLYPKVCSYYYYYCPSFFFFCTMSPNMGRLVLAALTAAALLAALVETVLANKVCGFTLSNNKLSASFLTKETSTPTYPLLICLVLKAASFCVAGDMRLSDGEMYVPCILFRPSQFWCLFVFFCILCIMGDKSTTYFPSCTRDSST